MREAPYTSNCLFLGIKFRFYCTCWPSFLADSYPGLPQKSKIECLATVVYGFYPLTIVSKIPILDICGSPRYSSEFGKKVTV